MGKADNTQRAYKRQLKNFSAWCNKSWLDVIPSDIGKYRRELKQQELKPASINHALTEYSTSILSMATSQQWVSGEPTPADRCNWARTDGGAARPAY